MMTKPFGLYVHIPFCARKCLYCDFLSFPASEELRESYLRALFSEIERKGPLYRDRRADTVFIGGGTPSLLEAESMERLLERLRAGFSILEQAEITIEANPGTLTLEKLKRWKRAGVSRLSLGLQSADDEELRRLGRIHTFGEFTQSYGLAREAGFFNINVDLMSALPGQSQGTYERTLHTVCGMEPEHISAYSLIVEEGTPFFEKYTGAGASALPDEETDRLMYRRTKEILEDYGYRRYEISNYAKPGFVCRHNLSYWKRTDYLGLGLGAASMTDNTRRSNTRNMQDYIRYYDTSAEAFSGLPGPEEERSRLSVREQMEEFMFLGLRMTDGILEQDFEEAFGEPVDHVYGGVLERLSAQSLIRREQGRIALTDYGTDVSNRVFECFLF